MIKICEVCSKKYDSKRKLQKSCSPKCCAIFMDKYAKFKRTLPRFEREETLEKLGNEPSQKVIAQIVGAVKVGKNEVYKNIKKCKCGNPLARRTDDECVNCYSESLKGDRRIESVDSFQYISAKPFKL